MSALKQADNYFSYLSSTYFGGCIISYFTTEKKYEEINFLSGGIFLISVKHFTNIICGYNQQYLKTNFISQLKFHIIATLFGIILNNLDSALNTCFFYKERTFSFLNTLSFYLFTQIAKTTFTILK